MSSKDFYPRSPCGERRSKPAQPQHRTHYFYPRSPCGERPRIFGNITTCLIFLSTLSLRRATLYTDSVPPASRNFYPRSPCGERLWHMWIANNQMPYFYPRSPCGERRHMVKCTSGQLEISIHALLAESDLGGMSERLIGSVFLSTLSLRRATAAPVCAGLQNRQFLSTLSLRRATFGPILGSAIRIFLSTLSLRRATAKVHKTVGHFCAYETNFMGIASSC